MFDVTIQRYIMDIFNIVFSQTPSTNDYQTHLSSTKLSHQKQEKWRTRQDRAVHCILCELAPYMLTRNKCLSCSLHVHSKHSLPSARYEAPLLHQTSSNIHHSRIHSFSSGEALRHRLLYPRLDVEGTIQKSQDVPDASDPELCSFAKRQNASGLNSFASLLPGMVSESRRPGDIAPNVQCRHDAEGLVPDATRMISEARRPGDIRMNGKEETEMIQQSEVSHNSGCKAPNVKNRPYMERKINSSSRTYQTDELFWCIRSGARELVPDASVWVPNEPKPIDKHPTGMMSDDQKPGDIVGGVQEISSHHQTSVTSDERDLTIFSWKKSGYLDPKTIVNREIEEKKKIVDFLKNNPSLLKPYKVTKQQLQEIMSDFITNKPIHLLMVHALALYYHKHIVIHFTDVNTYIEYPPNDDTKEIHIIICGKKKDTKTQRWKPSWTQLDISDVEEYYQKLKETSMRQYSWKQILHPCSHYKVLELYKIAETVNFQLSFGVNDRTDGAECSKPKHGQKWTKPELYQALLNYFEQNTIRPEI